VIELAVDVVSGILILAASVIETLGAGLLIAGLMLQAGFTLISLKLFFIFVLFFFTGPVATHALAQAALGEDIKPQLDEDRRERLTVSNKASADGET
jgi:multicomponent Na+:H+ antiporter subunit G